MKPRLLDLFCGAGGAGMGYARAGFEVVGVDIEPQEDYPFEFVEADALEFLDSAWRGDPFDVIHASPPCQDHSPMSRNQHGTGWLLAETVKHLQAAGAAGKLWVCENVVGPDVKMAGWWFVLCGSMFDMQIRRHRRFGSNVLMMPPACRHAEQGRPYTITGLGGACDTKHSLQPDSSEAWRYMDMPWMEGVPYKARAGVTQAIPPAYTEWIGAQLLAQLGVAA